MPKEGHKRKHKLAERDGWFCHYCKRDIVCVTCDETRVPRTCKYPDEATIEHLIPQVHGGTWGYHNLVLACCRCNNLRGDLIVPSGTTGEDLLRMRKQIQREQRKARLESRLKRTATRNEKLGVAV